MSSTLEAPTLAEIRAARERIAASAIGTPLVRLDGEGTQSEMGPKAGTGKIVCVVSGGNIDTQKLAKILAGEVP